MRLNNTVDRGVNGRILVEWHWKDKNYLLGDKPILLLPHYPPQIPRGIGSKPNLHGDRTANNRLSHSSASLNTEQGDTLLFILLIIM